MPPEFRGRADVVLYSLKPIDVGAHAVVSQRAYWCTGSHAPSRLDFLIYYEPIVIGDGCWIATDVYVGPGVTVGDGPIVGARPWVYNDLPAGKVCPGSAVRVVRDRELSR